MTRIDHINAVMYVHTHDDALAAEAAHLPGLAEAWKSPFHRRVGLIAYQEERRKEKS